MQRPRDTNSPLRLIVLGSTGSIGCQTFEVVRHLNDLHRQGRAPFSIEVVGLAAGRNADALFTQAGTLGVRDLALADNGAEHAAPDGVTLRRGPDAAEQLVREVEADIVLAAMVGAAGLPATLTALELGRDVALANKETLVAAGEIVVPIAQRNAARLFPVDSEHSAIWQCLGEHMCPPCTLDDSVHRIILTASGGPFRTRSLKEIHDATPEQALAHPTWSMGAKVTIDSASMTNKALEIIEAHWLFGVESQRIDVVVHPPSIVHSMVEFADGSVVAQLGAPDMRTPIQHALVWPARLPGLAPSLDWRTLGRLDFEPADTQRFPALALAHRVIEMGGTSGAVFNAANERAVEAFLERQIPFGRITELTADAVRAIVGSSKQPPLRDLEEALRADAEARRYVESRINA